MKKRILFYFGTAVLVAGIFGACSKEQVVKTSDEDNIAQQLKFVQVDERIKEKLLSHSREEIVIVEWDEWGRAKKNCKGFGLCNADWFPHFYEMPTHPNPINGGASILELNHINNKYYFDILMANVPPSSLELIKLTLEIDYDIVLDTQTKIGTNLKINHGMYTYDSSMGAFGGYRIYLDTI